VLRNRKTHRLGRPTSCICWGFAGPPRGGLGILPLPTGFPFAPFIAGMAYKLPISLDFGSSTLLFSVRGSRYVPW
jgi:hypothetical protein